MQCLDMPFCSVPLLSSPSEKIIASCTKCSQRSKNSLEGSAATNKRPSNMSNTTTTNRGRRVHNILVYAIERVAQLTTTRTSNGLQNIRGLLATQARPTKSKQNKNQNNVGRKNTPPPKNRRHHRLGQNEQNEYLAVSSCMQLCPRPGSFHELTCIPRLQTTTGAARLAER